MNLEQLFIFIITSFISADANITNKDRENNIKNLQMLKEKIALELKEDSEKLIKYCDVSINILKEELKNRDIL